MVEIIHFPLSSACRLMMEVDKGRGRAVMMAGNVECRGAGLTFCYSFQTFIIVYYPSISRSRHVYKINSRCPILDSYGARN